MAHPIEPQECFFDHEKLDVYQESITFISWLAPVLESGVRFGEIKDQIERASSSISLNIAEGNGRFSHKDRGKFFEISLSSAFECSACLDVMVARSKLTRDAARPGKVSLQRIVRMLVGLLKSIEARNYPSSSQSS
jgi:four helix bundle protein